MKKNHPLVATRASKQSPRHPDEQREALLVDSASPIDIRLVLEAHMSKLQQANEHLVISALQAQMMTKEIQKAKDRMGHMAHHDSLTNLPNRILLKERTVQALSLAKRHHSKLAVLFIDLDRFKTINDSLGHAAGDKLLQEVAQRLLDAIRSTDTVSRQGGDEFVLLLSEVVDEHAVSTFVDKMCRMLNTPYVINDQELHVGCSIGISMFPEDGDDAETLIGNADLAMYHAKKSGRDRYHFFKPEMNARAVERQTLEGDLHRAIKNSEFELYYQAQSGLASGYINSAEALIRWHHPARGLLMPGMFVPIAEESGAIVRIGRWVLHEACRQMQVWLADGLLLDVVAVNISALEFGRDDFLQHVRDVLRHTGLPPHHLELELTETVLMKDASETMRTLSELHAMGVRIAIDDFGTGYSSLSYLKQFPVDTLKIDKSFVAGITDNDGDKILVDAVICLGKNLGHRVVAEGIENLAQLEFLRSHACLEGQGYFLGLPMVAEQFSRTLNSRVGAGGHERL